MLNPIRPRSLVQHAFLRKCIKAPVVFIIRGYATIKPTNRRPGFNRLDDDAKALRFFLEKMTPAAIPRSICKVSFSKSSGPGGQSVNKLNTKAEVRLNVREVEDKLGWPVKLIDAMATHRNTTNDGDIVVTSQRYRTQTQNLEDAYQKLYEFIKNLVRLPGMTSLDAVDRIEKLKRRDKERVREWKTAHSEKKKDRQGSARRHNLQDDYGD